MRLTYELGHKGSGEYDTDNTKDMPANNIWKAVNKLGQLEDIEEELGIDLITLFKALKGGIWFIYHKPEYEKNPDLELNWGKWMLRIDYNIAVNINDYGKTWALTKGELL